MKRTAVINDKENGRKRYRWVVEFIVDDTWVEEGFDLDDDRAKHILATELGWAHGTEPDARVVAAPDPEAIRRQQGYEPA